MTDSKSARDAANLDPKLAGAPISWGVCEVPGWGLQLPVRHVLSEMRGLGISATEAGAEGYLPNDGDELARLLGDLELRLVGGFVPVVLHEPAALERTLAQAGAQADRFARAGGEVLVSAIVVDEGWSPRVRLARDDWRRIAGGLARIDELCAARGIAHAVHPHVGTLVQTRDDVERLLDASDVRMCLDTGHFAIGGIDSAAFLRQAPERVTHVHLKDVRAGAAVEVAAGESSLRDATLRGLFVPLGDGDAPVAEVLRALRDARYDGWYVLEQDAVIGGVEDSAKPTADMRRSIDFLRTLRVGRELAAGGAGGR
jgi:inosose dehydratase